MEYKSELETYNPEIEPEFTQPEIETEVTQSEIEPELLPVKTIAPKCGLSVYPMRLKPGQEVKKCLEDFVQENDLKAAFVLTCVGSVTKATLRFAANKNAETNRIETLEEHFEITSLVGTISQDGTHLHTTLSRNDGTTVGGHVISDMIVFTTAEIMLGNCESMATIGDKSDQSRGEIVFKRPFDAQTGFDELQICTNNDPVSK